MQPKRAIEKLNELKETVDGDLEEMVDNLATLVMLRQDMSYPMLGAKITLYRRPPSVDYNDAERVPSEDAPEPESDGWNWQWSGPFEDDDGDTFYRFQPKENEDDPDLIEHEAIVIDGDVAGDAPDGLLYDPNQDEYMTAEDYPHGTVNCVVAQEYNGDELKSFSNGYATDVEVFTSITPAGDDPAPNQYTPGWPD